MEQYFFAFAENWKVEKLCQAQSFVFKCSNLEHLHLASNIFYRKEGIELISNVGAISKNIIFECQRSHDLVGIFQQENMCHSFSAILFATFSWLQKSSCSCQSLLKSLNSHSHSFNFFGSSIS